MVDTYGRWTEEKDYSTYPKEKWCDYDIVANYIRNELHYEPETDMENLITMIFLHADDEILDDMGKVNENLLRDYIWGSGGIKEFDYYC